jgi:hypothetical protein
MSKAKDRAAKPEVSARPRSQPLDAAHAWLFELSQIALEMGHCAQAFEATGNGKMSDKLEGWATRINAGREACRVALLQPTLQLEPPPAEIPA